MKQQDPIQFEVEQTLDSLDGLESARPTPFFYGRLKARLEREAEAEGAESNAFWFLKPALQLATLCVLLILNLVFLFNEPPASVEDRGESIAYVMDEFGWGENAGLNFE